MSVVRDIVILLKEKKWTIRQLSEWLDLAPEIVVLHLSFVPKEISPLKLKMVVPQCNICGFEFKNREKGKPPSRCPRCKGEDIEEPMYYIL